MLTVLVLAQLDVTNKLQQTICWHLNWNFWGPFFMANSFTRLVTSDQMWEFFEDSFYKTTPTQRTALGKYPERSIGNFCTIILNFIKYSQISGTWQIYDWTRGKFSTFYKCAWCEWLSHTIVVMVNGDVLPWFLKKTVFFMTYAPRPKKSYLLMIECAFRKVCVEVEKTSKPPACSTKWHKGKATLKYVKFL